MSELPYIVCADRGGRLVVDDGFNGPPTLPVLGGFESLEHALDYVADQQARIDAINKQAQS